MVNYKKLCEELIEVYPMNDYSFKNAMRGNIRGFQEMCGEAADAIKSLQDQNGELFERAVKSERDALILNGDVECLKKKLYEATKDVQVCGAKMNGEHELMRNAYDDILVENKTLMFENHNLSVHADYVESERDVYRDEYLELKNSIVSCGECKKYNWDNVFHLGYCDGKMRFRTDFCSSGERKENE